MTIYSGSRYANARISAIEDKNGVVKQFVHSRKVYNENHIGPKAHAVDLIVGEELDILAFSAWDIEERWWFLCDVNNIMFPLFDDATYGPNELHIGTSLQVPSRKTMQVLTS